MYRLIVKGTQFTIPKENIRLLAVTKSMDCGQIKSFKSNEDAISFLNSIGIEVEDCDA